jgi:hypothetical protein
MIPQISLFAEQPAKYRPEPEGTFPKWTPTETGFTAGDYAAEYSSRINPETGVVEPKAVLLKWDHSEGGYAPIAILDPPIWSAFEGAYADCGERPKRESSIPPYIPEPECYEVQHA